MVAETVKSYPYPALLPLTQQGLNYSCTTSCSSALLPQALSQAPYASAQSSSGRMERNSMSRSSSSDMANSTPSGLGAGGLMGGGGGGGGGSAAAAAAILKESIFAQRKQREFIPENKKDDSYWDRRRRNNEAAKRSREKRRFNDMILEQRVLELSKENHLLRAQLNAFESKFHIKGEGLVNEEQVLASMPQADQILSLTRRPNLSLLSMASPPSLLSPSSLSSSPPAIPTSLADEDQYSLTQYSQHQLQDQTCSPSPQQSMRSHSPDFYSQRGGDQPQPQQSFSPESLPNFYESTALNLSARSSRSPVHMEYCDDQLNRSSSDYPGSSLPHKLRHKTHQPQQQQLQHHQQQQQHHNGGPHHTAATTLTSHMSLASHHHHHQQHLRPQSTSPLRESLPPMTAPHLYHRSPSPPSSHYIHHHLHQQTTTATITATNTLHPTSSSSSSLRPSSPSTSPSSSTHLMYPIKCEPLLPREAGEESPQSSDDRDSGISVTSSPTLPGENSYPSSNRDSTEDMECDSDQLRAELHRLATEVRSLKHILNRSVDSHRNNSSSSNGSRR